MLCAMTPQEAYRILGLAPGAGAEAVQEAYRRHALDKHPDRAQGVGLHDRAAWLKVRDAYECLRAAGFPNLAPPPVKPAEKPRYRAPEWLERQWANEKPERLSDHLRLDEEERKALVKTVIGFVAVVAAVWLLWGARERLKTREFSPRPGWTIRW